MIIMVSVKKLNFKRILIIIVAVLLVFSVVSMVATKIIYDSIFVRYDCEIKIPKSLTSLTDLREEKGYYSGENKLSAYLYRCDNDQDKDTLIIIAPGFNACADNYLWQIQSFLNLGWSVFAFNSTGCCNSEGDSTVGFPQELCDLEATLKYVEKNDRFGYNDIVIFGHSRGGYAACCALSYDYDISAVVSVSGINSAMEGIMGSSTEYVGPVAYGNYGFLWLYQALIFGADTLNLAADEEISKSDVPVLLVHGKEDTQVPIDRYSIVSHKDEITSQNVEYLIRSSPDNSGHTDLLFDEDGTANDELMQEIHEFLLKSIK